jgi:hypothetical protein
MQPLTGRKNPQAVAVRACRTLAFYCTAEPINFETLYAGVPTMKSSPQSFIPKRSARRSHRSDLKHRTRRRRATFECLERRNLLAVVVPDSVLSIGGPVNDSGQSVAVDTAGNYYLTGGFRGTVDFDLGPGTTNLISDGVHRDIFVSKYQADGSLAWARRFGGPSFDNEWLHGEVQVDANGKIYVLCDFAGTVTFGGDPTFGDLGAFTFTTADSTTDHVLLRFDNDGNLEWATWFGGAEPQGFVLDGNGAIYAAGHFTGTRQFGNQQLTAISSKSSSHDGFLSRLDANTGAFSWTTKTNGTGNESFTSIAIDPSGSGSLYLTGTHNGVAAIGSSTLSVKGKFDSQGFVAKAGLAGNFNWAKILAKETAHAYGAAVVNGSVIVTGTFDGSRVDFGNIRLTNRASGVDLYAARLDASGNILWAVNAGNVSGTSAAVRPIAITSDAFGNVFITGSFGQTSQFGPDLLTSNGTSDRFVSQLNGATGQFLKSWRMGGPLNEDIRGDLTTDAAGNLWVTGWYYGTADFPTGQTLNSVNDSGDIFLLRFLQNPPVAMASAVSSFEANDMESFQTQAKTNPLTRATNSAIHGSLQLLAASTDDGTSTMTIRRKEDASQRLFDGIAESIDAAVEEIDYGKWQKIVTEFALTT